LQKLGIENVGVFFTRGVLIDVAVFRGVERMKAGEVITPDDLEGALKRQKVTVGEGDVVLLRTGHGQLWIKDNEAFGRGEPGIGMAAAKWLAARKIVLVGSDTWATEVVPHENKDRPFEVHQLLLVRHGIYNLENLDLEEMGREKSTSLRSCRAAEAQGCDRLAWQPHRGPLKRNEHPHEDHALRDVPGQRRVRNYPSSGCTPTRASRDWGGDTGVAGEDSPDAAA
jgi:kynurenine formamidase